MRIISFILIFLFSLTIVLAQSPNLAEMNQELAGKEIPAPLNKLFGDEQINIYFTLDGGEEIIIGLVTKDNKFERLVSGSVEDPSLNVYTTEAVVKKIENSDNSFVALQEALDNDEITYKAVGLANKVKFGVLGMLIKIGGWFGGDDEVEEEVVVEEEVIPEETPVVEKEDVVEVKEEVKEVGPKNYVVKLIDSGFEVKEISVKVGDTIEWKNIRSGNFKLAMIIGVQQCSKIKSGFFEPGESFSWKFDKAESCTIVDGVYTTESMKVEVSE